MHPAKRPPVAKSMMAILAFVLSSGPLLLAQKPIHRSSIFVERDFVPRSLEDLFSRSTCVVLAGLGPAELFNVSAGTGNPPITYTRFRINVHETFKCDGHIDPMPSYVLRQGYERDTGDRIEVVEESGFPLFSTGQECVLFMNWFSSLNAYHLVSGPDGAYCASEQGLKTFGRSDVAKARKNVAVSSLLNELRQLAAGR